MTPTRLPSSASATAAPYNLATGVPFEYPMAEGVVGSAIDLSEKTPKLFQPLKVKNMVLPNRIGVSPMCQYTADNNEVTEYHKVHYGGLATRGPGLVVVEATSVAPYAVTSVVDLGIWKDSQAEKFRPIVQYAHANTSRIGIQIGHAGRKAMQSALFEYLENWDPRGKKDEVVAPSAVIYRPGGRLPIPRELTIEEIQVIVKQFGQAAKRAVDVGFDFVEIHAAHGYLINEFMSSLSNKRTDQYGGSFENRIRFLMETIDSVRANVPESYPVFLRWSASELSDNPDSWTAQDSVKLAPLVVKRGIDLLDISAGGNDSMALRIPKGFGMYVDIAKQVKEAVRDTAVVSCVGRLNDATKVNDLLEQGAFDFAFVGTPFVINQGLVYEWAEQLGVEIHHAPSHWPVRMKIEEMMQYVMESMAQAQL